MLVIFACHRFNSFLIEPTELDSIKANRQHYYREDNFIKGTDGAHNNWGKGHYTEGAELAEDLLMDRIRAEVERSDCLHGFQLVHGIAGGTGAGLGSLILMKLREDYPDRMLWTYSATGSNRGGEAVVAPYNQVLTMHYLIEHADSVVYLDDDAAYSIAWKYNVVDPQTHHVNTLFANIISDVTSGMRFRTQSRSDLRKLSFNLAPFPRVHFYVPARSPLSANILENKSDITTFKEITTQMFRPENLLLHENLPKNGSGKHLAASCIFRGDIPSGEIDDQIAQMQSKHSASFIEWIPDNLKTSLCSRPPINLNMSGTALMNTSAIIDNLKFTSQRFNAMYKRRAFLMWYSGEGMDQMEFAEAFDNLETLIADYQRYQDVDIKTNLAFNPEDEVV